MRSRFYFLLFFPVFSPIIISSQTDNGNDTNSITFYYSYDELLKEKGDQYDEFIKMPSWQKITVAKEQKKTTFSLNNFWGWKYKGVLFRVQNTTETCGAVIENGSVVYYENGHTWMYYLKQGARSILYPSRSGDKEQYLSKKLDSDMVALVWEKDIKEFKANNPDLASLIDCVLKDWTNPIYVKKCVAQFIN